MTILVTTFTFVKNGGAFICTSQLLRVIADLGTATLFTWLVDNTGRLHVSFGNGLHFGAFGTERGGESRGF